jgi:hypothetical protein
MKHISTPFRVFMVSKAQPELKVDINATCEPIIQTMWDP